MHIFDLKEDKKDENKLKNNGILLNRLFLFIILLGLGLVNFCSKIFTTVSQTVLPKDYQDYYGILFI
jgi:hypothetical protein